jgi:hypothetical protein
VVVCSFGKKTDAAPVGAAQLSCNRCFSLILQLHLLPSVIYCLYHCFSLNCSGYESSIVI